MTTALKGVRVQRHAPAALYSEKDPVPIVHEAEWTPGAENVAPTGIRYQTVQPVASRYTDYATRTAGDYTVNAIITVTYLELQLNNY
jgi:hypothetical protein